MKKDSGAKLLEMYYNADLKQLSLISSDNKLELFKVNLDNKEQMIKKLLRVEKRRALKRKRQEGDH